MWKHSWPVITIFLNNDLMLQSGSAIMLVELRDRGLQKFYQCNVDTHQSLDLVQGFHRSGDHRKRQLSSIYLEY